MRRFEFVEGTSAKFWSPQVEGSTFVVAFGRLGTAGQRKEKVFPTPEAATKEYDKKVAEKIREGYHEVAADAAAQAAPGAKGAAAASAPLQLPPRLRPHVATSELQASALAAVKELEAAVGSRSWVVARAARKARKALAKVAGPESASDSALRAAIEGVMAKVSPAQSAQRLPLKHAMALLGQLDAQAFAKATRETWKSLPVTHPAAEGVSVLAQQLESLGDEELAFRVGQALIDPTQGWRKHWTELAPHLEAYLVHKRTSVKHHFGSVAAAHPKLAERTRALTGG